MFYYKNLFYFDVESMRDILKLLIKKLTPPKKKKKKDKKEKKET